VIRFLRAHALPAYFILAFLISWSIWIPLALNHYGLLPVRLTEPLASIAPLFGTLGPAIAASLIALLAGAKPGLKELWGQIAIWRVKWTWYVAASLVFPVLVFVVAWIYSLLPGARPLPYQGLSLSGILTLVVALVISVTGEEVGWRGFALPQLQKRRSALQASLLLGTLHTLWHLPFWTALGELTLFGWPYWILSWFWVLALSIYITWIMNNTGNSLLLAFLLHWSMNAVMVGFLPITTVVPAYILFIVIAWSIALGLTAHYGARRLARAIS
jgi:uncharacterized protein